MSETTNSCSNPSGSIQSDSAPQATLPPQNAAPIVSEQSAPSAPTSDSAPALPTPKVEPTPVTLATSADATPEQKSAVAPSAGPDAAASISTQPPSQSTPNGSASQPTHSDAAATQDAKPIQASASSGPAPTSSDVTAALDQAQQPSATVAAEPPTARPPTEAPVSSGPMEITPAQLKFAQNTVKSLKSRREAIAFLKPVDPVALGVPQYPQIITHPMDLGTIDIKLALTATVLKPNVKPGEKAKQAPQWNLDPAKDYYRSLAEFESDVRLVFSNCAKFNGAESPYTQSAQVLEAALDKYMKDAPPLTSATVAAEAGTRSRRPSNPVPTIRRSSSDAGGRPKREIHPPPSKDLPYANEPQGVTASVARKAASRKIAKKGGSLSAREEAHLAKVVQEELKFCTRVVEDLLKPSYSQIAWVFYEIPTMDYDWAPAYFQMIKRPISLRDVQKNIRSGKYADAEEFDADMQLIFTNCFTFNPPDSDVHQMGQQLKSVYEDKMSRKPAPPPLLPDYGESDEEDEEEEEIDDVDPDFMARLQEQITGLQSTLAMLEGAKNQNHDLIANTKAMLATLQESYATSGQSKKSPKKSGGGAGAKRKAASDAPYGGSGKKKSKAKASGSGGSAAGGAGDYVPSKKAAASSQKKKASTSKKTGGSKRGAGSDDDIRTVTYEQKEELAAKITELSEERLDGAIRIINEDKPPNQSEEEEIELDIDELSPRTLYKLYKYVVRPSKKAAAAAAAAKNNGRSAPIDGRKRGTGGLKKKNLDEGEEAERIARLQQQLEQFGNPDAVPTPSAAVGMHDDLVHSESSSEGESGSDSDSD